MKRNLTRIYIFEEGQPTCFEDCKKNTQDKWLHGLEREELMNLVKELANVIKDIGSQFNIVRK